MRVSHYNGFQASPIFVTKYQGQPPHWNLQALALISLIDINWGLMEIGKIGPGSLVAPFQGEQTYWNLFLANRHMFPGHPL